MSHIVRVSAGQKGVTLPNGRMYDGQVDVTLSDAEFARLSPTAISSGVLSDQGSTADPDVDAVFATDASVAAEAARATAAETTKAPLASPTFTGTPAAPTAAQGTNTTQLATTAYVQTEVGLLVPKSVLTTDGDLLTRTGGVPARLTRASLAADAAFTAAFAPKFVRDTAANLVAANTVYAAGVLVIATDTHVLALGDGATAYNSLPKYEEKLDPQRAEGTAQQATLSATTDITGLSVTFTVGSIPWRVEGYVPYVFGSAAGVTPFARLTDNAGTLKREAVGSTAAGASYFSAPISVREYISTPGTYTRKLQVRKVGTGSITVGGGSAEYVHYIDARPDR